MKQLSSFRFLWVLAVVFGLQACIGDDIIQDFVPAEVRIMSAPDSLVIGEPYQFTANFFNNIGEIEIASIAWTSSDETVLTIDEAGWATPLMEGEVVVTATIETADAEILTDQVTIQIATMVTAPTLKERAVTIATTSSYILEGTGVLKETDSGDLILEINSDWAASSNLPGLYVYLTNNPNTSSGALEIGPVTTFSGAHSYTISGEDIDAYSHVLYYCKPFNVKVGDGELAN